MSLQSESQLARFLSAHDIADYDALRHRAALEPEWFWRAVMAFHDLHFFRPFDQLLDVSNGPEWARWCVGGTTNLAFNCLDRTIAKGRGEQEAVVWEAENGDRRSLGYHELAESSARAAGGLRSLGIRPGDVVGLYMPMVPETIAAYLAIVRIGAIALPMFSGFGAQAVAERLAHAGAKAVISADFTFRRGKAISMIEVIDAAAPAVPTLRHQIIVERDPEANPVHPGENRHRWRELVADHAEVAAIEMPADAPAMIVYTSGTTGRPKGTVHTHCGFMTKVALDFGLILDLQPADRLFWMADMGWLTGPILAVASPLIGSTLILAEGTPDYPRHDRLWQLVQTHRVSFLGVAPTMIRSFIRGRPDSTIECDLNTLRVSASTGEPWTPEAWDWLRREMKAGQVPILNYCGGTEIGGGILAATVLQTDTPPGGFAGSIPGMSAAIFREDGQPTSPDEIGELALTTPSIGLTRGFWNDSDQYIESYWTKLPGIWCHGDLASRDENGFWFIHGRSDDTIKVAGKRVGPAEIESVLLGTGKVSEAAAVGLPDPIKGAAVVCVCTPGSAASPDADLANDLTEAVAKAMGASFRPKHVLFVSELPKTRSMKIMRRLIRSTLLAQPAGDVSGLVNPDSLNDLRKQAIGGKFA